MIRHSNGVGRRRTHQRGFTLLEVLVALAVIAVAMAAITRSTSVAANNEFYLKEKTWAHWVAMNKIAEIQLEANWPTIGQRKGDYEMVERKWRWEVDVSGTEDKDVRRMDVRVFERADAKEALAFIVAYVDRPL
ncbi:MAG: proteinral secretion pathway protein I [Halothiobacillaceae bacterium]|nr:MAG: proteinral secretion pathway protein I [Halothiobacillaceae bacterium]